MKSQVSANRTYWLSVRLHNIRGVVSSKRKLTGRRASDVNCVRELTCLCTGENREPRLSGTQYWIGRAEGANAGRIERAGDGPRVRSCIELSVLTNV